MKEEYGYCRISTPKQNIDRQGRNILKGINKYLLSLAKEQIRIALSKQKRGFRPAPEDFQGNQNRKAEWKADRQNQR